MHIFNYTLSRYKVPNEVAALEHSVVKKFTDHHHKNIQIYWYLENEKTGKKYDRVIDPKVTETFHSNKDNLSSVLKERARNCITFAYEKIERPLVIYSMETVLTRFVLIDRIKPLRIHVYNNSIVSYIQGPYFIPQNCHPEESMYFDKFTKMLKDRKYKFTNGIQEITRITSMNIILSVIAIWEKLMINCQEQSNDKSHGLMVYTYVHLSIAPFL